jgi:hypothetical protein
VFGLATLALPLSAQAGVRVSIGIGGVAENCAIFPIDSFWRLPIVALLKSEYESVYSNVNRINALGTLRDHIVLGHRGFCGFRDKTTL